MRTLIIVGAILAVLSYVALFVVNPYGYGYFYVIAACAGASLMSPLVGLLITGSESITINRYQLYAAVNIYASALSIYLLYSENPWWRLPVLLTSSLVVLAVASTNKEKKRRKHGV